MRLNINSFLEDCAFSLSSNGITLHNFIDAALFSSDRSKLNNIITGGLIYSNDKSLIHALRIEQVLHPEFSIEKNRQFRKDFYSRKNILSYSNLVDIVFVVRKG